MYIRVIDPAEFKSCLNFDMSLFFNTILQIFIGNLSHCEHIPQVLVVNELVFSLMVACQVSSRANGSYGNVFEIRLAYE